MGVLKAIFYIIGALYIIGAAANLNVIFETQRAKFIVKKIGRGKYRILVMLMGILLVALGYFIKS